MRFLAFLCVVCCIALCSPSLATAAIIGIQITGVDISYDASTGTIVDADPVPPPDDPDPLTSVAITVDDVLAGPVVTTGVTLDTAVSEISPIPVGGGTALGSGGIFVLDLPGPDFLSLDFLSPVEITYLELGTGSVQFVFLASVADVVAQSLPFGLEIGDNVSVSYSTQITPGSLVDDGLGKVTEFHASGTGEVEGLSVPEPTSVSLMLLGISSSWLVARRRINSQTN